MSSLLLQNATLVDFDPPLVEVADLWIVDALIQERGDNLQPPDGTETVDANGLIVLPGFVCAHTHLYSALACGMPAPPQTPTTFVEILEHVWWRLDRALDMESVAASAHAGAMDAILAGTTTLIDHHASPNAIIGSLECIDAALDEHGIRRVLCYEVTDRMGERGALDGIAAHKRLLEARCDADADTSMSAIMVGGHASFTLSDSTLKGCADLCEAFDVGFHIHVAEALSDVAHAETHYGRGPLQRLEAVGLLGNKTIIAHGTHLSREDLELAKSSGAWFAHNPRSNMNNQVGYAPTPALFPRTALGTDGIGADMWEEARSAWFKAQDAKAAISFDHIRQWIVGSHKLASEQLGVTLGKVQAGACADLIFLDHEPRTPLTSDNLMAHVIFSLSARHVRDVMIAGKYRVKNRTLVTVNASALTRTTRKQAKRLWTAMQELPQSLLWSPDFH